MENDRAHPDANIEVSAASSDQKAVLANLLELYQHDFSEFMELEIGLDGRYVYRDLDIYWTDPQRFPFLIFAAGKLAGFVLVRGISRQTNDAPRDFPPSLHHPSDEDLHPTNKDPFVGTPDLSLGTPAKGARMGHGSDEVGAEGLETVTWDMAEFFVLRGYRRSSVGTRSALEVFARFRGHWQVRVMQSNLPACAFWNRAVRLFAGDSVQLNHRSADGREWNVFSFHSPPLD